MPDDELKRLIESNSHSIQALSEQTTERIQALTERIQDLLMEPLR